MIVIGAKSWSGRRHNLWTLQANYIDCWAGLKKHFDPRPPVLLDLKPQWIGRFRSLTRQWTKAREPIRILRAERVVPRQRACAPPRAAA
jgi:hypothetical protein